MAEVRFFYIDDDTAVLFAANGTALTALLVGLADIVPLIQFSLPTFPMWAYFSGLIFAFFAKMVIQLINTDMRKRENLQAIRTFLMEVDEDANAAEELKDQIAAQWALVDQQHRTLLQAHHGPRLDRIRALSFFLSAICFLIGTATLIYYAGFITPSPA